MTLAPDSSSSSGSSASGAMTLIASALLASNTVISFTAISQAYRHLQLIGTIQANDAGAVTIRRAGIQFNADTGANYGWQNFEGASNVTASTPTATTTSATIGNVAGSGRTSVQVSGFEALIPNYANALNKQVIAKAIALYGATTAYETQLVGSIWVATAAITQIDLVHSGGTNFTSGSRVDLYGIL